MSSTQTCSRVYLASRLLCSPLEAMYTLLIFIATKELGIGPLLIAILASSKPACALLAFYCSASIANRPHSYQTYLIGINTVAALPVLFFPFIENSWFYAVSQIVFMVALRAVFPVWNAILKNHMSLQKMSRLQSTAITLQQGLTIFCPLIFGLLMDTDKEIWKTLFCLLGVLQLLNSLLLLFTPKDAFSLKNALPEKKEMAFKQVIGSFKLLKTDLAFLHYLLMFFVGGTGLVMMQAALPVFFKECLNISYTSLTLAISVCKGLGLISTTRAWASLINKITLFRLNYFVNILSALFIMFIWFASYSPAYIYVAYLIYGAMQAGCELSWNMNAPIFARKEAVATYACLNLPLIGVRGLIFPFLAQMILWQGSVYTVFMVAGLLTLLSAAYADWLDKQQKTYTVYT